MNFLDSINQGIAAAEKADSARNEVIEFFRELNVSLSGFNGAKVSIHRGVSAMTAWGNIPDLLNPNLTKEYFDQDRIILITKNLEETNSQDATIANWRQHVKGYPCVLSFEGEEYNCFSKKDLERAFEDLFKSVAFGKALMKSLAELKKNSNT